MLSLTHKNPDRLALDEWAYKRSVKLDYTRPGKPTDNELIESLNGRLRDEFLNANWFITMHDLRTKRGSWQEDYNHRRPHGSNQSSKTVVLLSSL